MTAAKPTLAETIITALRSSLDEGLQERILEAALLIEKFRGLKGCAGISAAVDAASVSETEIAEMKSALMHFASFRRGDSNAASVLWALGKFQDKSLTGFFLNEMREHLAACRHLALWQIDCALGDIGEGTATCGSAQEANSAEYFQPVADYLKSR